MPPRSTFGARDAIKYLRLSFLGRWRTISGNMRPCQSFHLFIFGSALLNCGPHFTRRPGQSLLCLNARHRFTLTPQRMRMIVEAFAETLELGLAKYNQIVVCIHFTLPPFSPPFPICALFRLELEMVALSTGHQEVAEGINPLCFVSSVVQ